MRRNHDKHSRKQPSIYEKYDIIYTPMPEIGGTRLIVAHPLKAIYINRAAREEAVVDREFRDIDVLLDFIARHGIELP